MKISIVDIGSNAVKYKIFNSNNFELIEYYREPLRLGRDVFNGGKLLESTMDRLIKLLQNYSNIFDEKQIEHRHFIATSAIRDSKNSDLLAKKLNDRNIYLKILSGKQEASLLESFNKEITNSAVIDIGGGSVEVCINKDSKMFYESFQLGAVRLLNISKNERKNLMKDFGNWLSLYNPIAETIGLGGNLRSLMQVNDHEGKITIDELKELIDKYNSIDKNILLNEFKIPEDRIDIVPIAAEIYLYFLNHIGAKTIENSFWSISDGLVKKVVKEEL
tara:strand:- start:793 stop:1620 length:828 start_codon:yes stop_codon:yes gene_type:complete